MQFLPEQFSTKCPPSPTAKSDHLFGIQFFLCLVIVASLGASLVHAQPLNGKGSSRFKSFNEFSKFMEEYFQEKFFSKGIEPGRGSGYKPFKRLQWFYERRFYEGSGYQPGIRRRALEQVKNDASLHSLQPQPVWIPIGPASGVWPSYGKASGRIRTVAVSPADSNTIYIGAAGGGIWKTTNRGVSWVPIADNLMSITMGALVIDPFNTNTIYAGTGEIAGSSGGYDAIGIIKSTDGGQSWVQTPVSGSDMHAVAKLVLDPSNSQIVYAAGDGGIIKSTDAGSNWEQLRTDFDDATDLVIDEVSPQTLYAAAGYFGWETNGIWKSTNGGDTWFHLTSGLPAATSMGRTSLGIGRTAPSLLYAAVSNDGYDLLGFYRSSNSGASWTKINGAPNFFAVAGYPGQGWYDNVLAVEPSNDNIVYVGGTDLYRSTNMGASWTNLTNAYSGGSVHPDQHALCFSGNTLYDGNDGGLNAYAKVGGTWSNLNANLAVTQFYAMGTTDVDSVLTYGGTQDNGTLKGQGAMLWPIVYGGDGGVPIIDYTNTNIIYAEAQNGYHVKSTNGGANWTLINNGISGSGPWVTPVIMDFTNPLILYTVNSTGTVYKTTNGGSSWFGIGTPGSGIVHLAVSKTAPQILFASNSSTLYKTTNGGSSWSSTPAPGYVTDIEVDHSSAERVLTTVSSAIGNSVFISTDGGGAWTNISSNLPWIAANAIAFDPSRPSTYYVATDVGCFYTFNNGQSWQVLGDGLPSVVCTDIAYVSPGKIRVATHGRSMFETTVPSSFPLPPQNLSFSVGNESVLLNWTRNLEPNVVRYRIYGGASVHPVQLLDSTTGGVNDTSKLLLGIRNGTDFFFRITAVDNNANESGYSNEIVATPVLLAPQNLVADPALTSVTLRWNRCSEENARGYKVYFRKRLLGIFTLVDSTSARLDTLKVISGLATDSLYVFAVAAVDTNNGRSAYSNAVIAKPSRFTALSTGLVPGGSRSMAWGDYDNDGDLDLVIPASSGTVLYRNDNGMLNNSGVVLPGIVSGAVAWGDLDNDGDLDLVLTGYDGSTSISKIFRNDNGTFTDINAGLIGVRNSSVAWGDYDNDGDLDLLIMGQSGSGATTSLYQNNMGTFTLVQSLVGQYNGEASWGDYDNDGDLDLLIAGATGISNPQRLSRIYRNDSGFLVNTSISLTAFESASVAWVDYDSDGDLDAVIAGSTGITLPSYTKIYRNNNGNFTDIGASIVGIYNGSMMWGDYDNDGDNDLLLTGIPPASGGNFFLYRNDAGTFTDVGISFSASGTRCATFADYDNDGDLDILLTANTSRLIRNNLENINTPPSIPNGLISVRTLNTVRLTWTRSSDYQTPKAGLNYNIRVGSSRDGIQVVSPMASLADGYRRIVALGNAFADTTWGLKNLQDGHYYWSVQSIDNSYLPSGFSLTDSFVVVTPPSPPLLVTPTNGSVGNGLSLLLGWRQSERATAYRVQVATDTGFTQLILNDSTLVDTARSISGLLPLTTYYWRVTASNPGGTSAFSGRWSFRTKGVPAVIALVSPGNNAVNQPTSLLFAWRTSVDQTSIVEPVRRISSIAELKDAEAEQSVSTDRLGEGQDQLMVNGYWFELTTDTTGQPIVSDTTLTDTVTSVGGLSHLTSYYWRAKGRNEIGWGNFSPWWKFTTIIAAPIAPLLVTPDNGSIGNLSEVSLRWRSSPTATSYQVQIAMDSAFVILVVNDSTLTDTLRTVSGLQPLTTYYWRVNAKNLGGRSDYSERWSFRTMGVPTTVALVSPIDSALGQPVDLTFVWRRSFDQTKPSGGLEGRTGDHAVTITKYWFELATDTAFTTIIVRDSTLADTSRGVSGLNHSTTYYWRVRAKNEVGWSGPSTRWKLTTIIQLPGQVTLLSPLHGAVVATDTVALSWNPATPSITAYWVERSRDSLFVSSSIDSTIVNTTYVIRNLANDTTYWWKVRARNEAGWGAFSEGRKFSVRLMITVSVPVDSGWNLVSNPVTTLLDSVQQLFPSAESPWAFAFVPGTGYRMRFNLENGLGYWVKFSSGAGTSSIIGAPRSQDSIPVAAGWNLIGSISSSVDTASIFTVPPGLLASLFFGYSGRYLAVSQLDPGKGYWAKSSGDGVFVLASSLFSRPIASSSDPLEAMNTLAITDASGARQVLYLGSGVAGLPPIDFFELPPAGPEGMFDARFESQRMLEILPPADVEERNIGIAIRAYHFPIHIIWDVKTEDRELTLNDGVGGRLFSTSRMLGKGEFTITNPAVTRVVLSVGNSQLPQMFELEQNYPNPFNPSTIIKYDLPTNTHVALKIFNVLGQEVTTLVNEQQHAGYRSVEWNASNMASGVYFCRLQAGEFTKTRKLMLVK